MAKYTNVLPTYGYICDDHAFLSVPSYFVWGDITNGGFSIILYPDGHYICGRIGEVDEFKEFFAFLKQRGVKEEE